MEIIKIVENPHLGKLAVAILSPKTAKFVVNRKLDWVVFDQITSFETVKVFDNYQESLQEFPRLFQYVGFPFPAKDILLDLMNEKD